MVCEHLRRLYDLCETQQLRFSSGELIRIACKQCELDETCPSVLYAEYEQKHPETDDTPAERA